MKHFRGSELQNYFTKVLEDNLKALIKPQYVDHIPRAIKGELTVSQMLDQKLELDNKQQMLDELELNEVLERQVTQLSGGELQRFAIAMSCIQRADVSVKSFPCLKFTDTFIKLHVRRTLELSRYQTTITRCPNDPKSSPS